MKSRIIASLLVLATAASAQVNVTSGNYIQNFDTLANTGSGLTWTDNTTLQGWYTELNGSTVQSLNVASGRNGSPLSSYGSVNSTDRALGTGFNSIGSGVALSFGVRLVNNTGFAFTGFGLSYTGEQWARNAHSTPYLDYLSFSYQIFAANTGSLTTSLGWTTFPSLTFTSPNSTPATVQADLDGNALGNYTNLNSTVTGILLMDGQELWLRWTATNVPAAGHDLAIDNLNVSFGTIPEPASFAAIAGILALAGATSCRKRKKTKI